MATDMSRYPGALHENLQDGDYEKTLYFKDCADGGEAILHLGRNTGSTKYYSVWHFPKDKMVAAKVDDAMSDFDDLIGYTM